jgi:hypothetical protein
MADFGTPVAQNVDVSPNKSIQTLSGLLSLQSQKLGLQGQTAQVQQEQQTASQRAGIASFMSSFDPTKHVGADGTLDLNEVLTDPKLRQAAGDQFPQIMQSMISAKQGQLTAKQQLADLNGSLRNQFSSTVGSLRTDPEVVKDTPAGRAKVQQALGDFAETGGEDAARVANVYGQVLSHVPPGKLSQTLSNFQLQAMDAGAQSGRQAPNLVDTGPSLVNTNPQAAGGNLAGTPDLKKGVAPSVISTPAGPVARVGGNGTTLTPLTTAPGPGGAPAPNLNQTTAEVETGRGLAHGVTERVSQAQSAANNTTQAQDALSRAKAIMETSGPDTGGAFEKLKGLKNLFASAGMDTEGATDANSLVKNLARYEAARATQAGLGGTDAARELAHNGSPNTAVDKKALIGIINQSLATEKALAAYASKQSKTTDPKQLMKNENDFRNIPHLIEGYEYGMSRNANEANLFLGKHGLKADEMRKTRQLIKQFESS